jgi:hypothetical protein
MTGRWAKPEVSRTGTEAKASRPWVSVTGGPEGRGGSGGKRQRTELASREEGVKPITRGPFGWGRNRTLDRWSLTANMALMTGAQVLAGLCLPMSAMLNSNFGGQTMTPEEKQERFQEIRKAMALIDNTAFEILNDVELESARGWVSQFREAHNNLGEMITHLADLVGIEEDRENGY